MDLIHCDGLRLEAGGQVSPARSSRGGGGMGMGEKVEGAPGGLLRLHVEESDSLC